MKCIDTHWVFCVLKAKLNSLDCGSALPPQFQLPSQPESPADFALWGKFFQLKSSIKSITNVPYHGVDKYDSNGSVDAMVFVHVDSGTGTVSELFMVPLRTFNDSWTLAHITRHQLRTEFHAHRYALDAAGVQRLRAAVANM